MIVPKFTAPEHLGDPFLGAWHVPNAFDAAEAQAVMHEVESSGSVEPVRDLPDAKVAQNFRRLVIDMTREHDFPRVEALGRKLSALALNGAGEQFPALHNFAVEEAAIQIYPAGATQALGWHKDHKADKFLVMSATLAGGGVLGFTEKTPYLDATEDDVIADIHTRAPSVVFLRAHELYEREDGSDIRVAHAVRSVDADQERFTIQYRMGVNAGAFDNAHVNADRPRRA